jgi:hypothetical protein
LDSESDTSSAESLQTIFKFPKYYGVNRMACSGVEDAGGAQSRCMLPFSHP